MYRIFCLGMFAVVLSTTAVANIAHQEEVLSEAEKAFQSGMPLKNLVNLRFFGTYAGMDQYLEQLDKRVCRRADYSIEHLLEQKTKLPTLTRSLILLTQARDTLRDVPIANQKKVSTRWSYRNFLTDLAKLDCVLSEGDQLAQSDDYIETLKAIKLYQSIDGYDTASQKWHALQAKINKYAQEATEVWAKKLSERDKVDRFEILNIALGMTYQDTSIFLPESRIKRDSRGTKSIPQLDVTYEKKLSIGNMIRLRVLIGKPGDSPLRAYHVHYEFDMKGLQIKQAQKVMEKLFEKYGNPDLDLTNTPKSFHINTFVIDLQSQYDPILKYCWGDCEYLDPEKPEAGLKKGMHLLMSYNKARYQLELNLEDTSQQEKIRTVVAPTNETDGAEAAGGKTEGGGKEQGEKGRGENQITEKESLNTPDDRGESATDDNEFSTFDPASLFDEDETDTLEF